MITYLVVKTNIPHLKLMDYLVNLESLFATSSTRNFRTESVTLVVPIRGGRYICRSQRVSFSKTLIYSTSKKEIVILPDTWPCTFLCCWKK
jgi:hypothetical protein